MFIIVIITSNFDGTGSKIIKLVMWLIVIPRGRFVYIITLGRLLFDLPGCSKAINYIHFIKSAGSPLPSEIPKDILTGILLSGISLLFV